MNIPPNELIDKLLEFMTVLYHCNVGTTYAGDRTIYANDIAMAMGWVVKARELASVEDVVEEILSPEVDKYFCDYWRQGEWGDKHIDAFQKLRSELTGA